MDHLKKLAATLVDKLFLETRYLLRNRYYIDYIVWSPVVVTHSLKPNKLAAFEMLLLEESIFEHSYKLAHKALYFDML